MLAKDIQMTAVNSVSVTTPGTCSILGVEAVKIN
jgi:hypothetical protein